VRFARRVSSIRHGANPGNDQSNHDGDEHQPKPVEADIPTDATIGDQQHDRTHRRMIASNPFTRELSLWANVLAQAGRYLNLEPQGPPAGPAHVLHGDRQLKPPRHNDPSRSRNRMRYAKLA
jgi:hypothetical protein